MSSQNECDCTQAGHCRRYRRVMTDREIHLCQTREDYRRIFERTAPPAGLGDAVETVIHAVGGHYLAKAWEHWTGKPCGCDERREALNQIGRDLTTERGPRVAFLTPDLGSGGTETWIRSLCRYLPSFGCQVTGVGILREGQKYDPVCEAIAALGIPVYGTVGVRWGYHPGPDTPVQFCQSDRDVARAACCGADVVISWGMGDIGQTLDAIGWQGRHVLSAHGAGEWSRRFIGDAVSSATHFTAVSRHAVSAYPVEARGMVKVLWNGSETDRLATVRGREAIRAEWGIRPDQSAIGYVGRLSSEKNPTLHVTACAGSPGLVPVLVGGGLEQEIRKYRRQAIETDSRTVLVDVTESVGDIYDALDVLCLLSDDEGWGLVLSEAWLCGLPVVVREGLGCVPEIDERHGAMCTQVRDCFDPLSLRSAIHHALSPSGRAIADHARQVALEHLTAEISAQRWAEWLREICPVSGR